MRKKVVIITEGGKNIGLGHLSRCFAIADAFKDKKMPCQIFVNGDTAIKLRFKEKSIKFVDWIKNEDKILGVLNDPDVLIMDSYLAKLEFYRKAANRVKLSLFIDDSNRIEYPTGIILNPALKADSINYHKNRLSTYLFGKKYVLLKKEFWNIQNKRIERECKEVIITVGGSDINNVMPRIMSVVNRKFPKIRKSIIVGEGFKNVNEIKKCLDKKSTPIYFPNTRKMIGLMLKADIAISSGGQTLFELARIGVPTLALCTADNQQNNLRGFIDSGFIDYLGKWDSKRMPSKIETKLKSLMGYEARKKKSVLGKCLVDGKGALRTVDRVLSIYSKLH